MCKRFVPHAVQKYSAVHVLPAFFFPLTALLPVEDVSGGARTHLGAAHVHFRDGMCCPWSVSGYHPYCFKNKDGWYPDINDLVEKKMYKAKGQTGRKKAGSTFVLHAVTTMGRYIMSGSWEKHGMRERAEQRWQPLRLARTPSSTVHACLPYPAAAPLPRYFTLGNFLNNALSGDFCFEADVPHIRLWTDTMSVSVSTVITWGCGVFDSTLSCFGFLLEMKAKLWLCSVLLAGSQSQL